MNEHLLTAYRCPKDSSQLRLRINERSNNNIIDGILISESNTEYYIKNGVADLTFPFELEHSDIETRNSYENLADDYEKFSQIPFLTYKVSESDVRTKMAESLNIVENSKVLEVGCGCGDGAVYIERKLTDAGELHLQELSPKFLAKAISKLSDSEVPIAFSVANACYLSYPDNYFDAAHHFGGLNTFSDVRRFLSEMARVVKPGGKVVIGDEGMAPWLRSTEFGKVMMNSNPLLEYSPPVALLPTVAKDVKLEWIMMGAFFTIEFTVADSEPKGNYHIPIPSERGGTHWSRYYGNLEGITEETKELAYQAQKKSGKSMHAWLDEAVRNASINDLNQS
jgi:ubiquinone/menaquinone biosynthesis C-methylase UbiE